MRRVSPYSYQLAYFLSNLDLSDKLNLAEHIRTKLGNFVDGSPTILPIPDNAPHEIPRIIYQSKTGVYSINVSQSRIDFIRNKSNDEAVEVDKAKEFLALEKQLTDLVFDDFKSSVYRLGIILNFNVDIGVSAIEYLKSNYKQTKPNPYQLEFNQQIQSKIESMKTNQWVRLTARNYDFDGLDKKNLNVLVDINTILEEKYKVNKDMASSFFSKSFSIAIEEVQRL